MPVSTRYQTTNPWVGLTDPSLRPSLRASRYSELLRAGFLARLLAPAGSGGGEGLYWGGAGDGWTGSAYPAFLALVQDDTGRMWPCGSSVATAIEVESSGAGSLP